jgi:hypothetical protein
VADEGSAVSAFLLTVVALASHRLFAFTFVAAAFPASLWRVTRLLREGGRLSLSLLVLRPPS